MINTYIDCEWYLNQRIFLIGYAYENTRTGKIVTKQLYDKYIYPKQVIDILNQTTGYVFIYGPDIGMLEKVFQIDIRNYSHCINLIKVVKEFYPKLNSYKLSEIEKKFGFHRAAKKYKADIFSIYKDWNDPKLRKLVLKYNKEDVYNLARVKQRIFAENKISKAYMQRIRLS